MCAISDSKICCTSGILSALHIVDQELVEALGQHVLFLVVPIINAGHQDLALELFPQLVVNTPGFLPVVLNFDLSVRLVWVNFLVLSLMILGFTRGFRQL